MFESDFVKKQFEAIGYSGANEIFPVLEVYKTVQGEGILIGVPSVFVRFAVCNLSCVWCDTKFTWSVELLKREKIEWLNCQNLVLKIIDVSGHGKVKNVVFTGGEPLIWWEKGLREVCNFLGLLGFFVEIETNGTIAPRGAENTPYLRFNVSFKLSNNRSNSESERIKDDVLKYFNSLGKENSAFFDRITWKLVVSSEQDLREIMDVMKRLGLDMRYLVVMPEAVSKEKLESYGWLLNWCIENGVRFCDRLHIRIWGNKRGV